VTSTICLELDLCKNEWSQHNCILIEESNLPALWCSGCRITVWTVSSNSALLYHRSHSICRLRETPLSQNTSYAVCDAGSYSHHCLCRLHLQGRVVGLCSSGVQNFDVLIDYRVCCACSVCLHSRLFRTVEQLHVTFHWKQTSTDQSRVAFPHFVIAVR